MAEGTTTALVPWDASDDDHLLRLYEQRVACSWAYQEVVTWKRRMLEGQKMVYWIVLPDDASGREGLIETHAEQFPRESEPLLDTATSLGGTATTPSEQPFHPVGHIALDAFPDRNARFGLPASTRWVKSLYVSRALQGLGIGRSAMRQLERIATGPPYNSAYLALDTRQDSDPALNLSAVPSNQAWYQRQGYRVMGCQDAFYRYCDPDSHQWLHLPAVFLKKALT